MSGTLTTDLSGASRTIRTTTGGYRISVSITVFVKILIQFPGGCFESLKAYPYAHQNRSGSNVSSQNGHAHSFLKFVEISTSDGALHSGHS